MPIARFQMPDGRIARFEVPDGTTPEQAQQGILAHMERQQRIADQVAADRELYDPARGMSGFEKFVAGYGSAVPRLARGVGQLMGLVSQEDVDEAKRLEAPLMRTGAGAAGNIAGNIAAAIPTVAIPGANTLAGSAVIGAGMGFAQPVASDESRLENTVIGGAAGAGGVALGRAVKAGYQGAKALAEPFYQAGRDRIAGRAIQRFADDPAAVAAARGGRSITGATPTLAEETGDSGMARLQDALRSLDPQIAGRIDARLAENNAARVGALRDLAGDGGKLDYFIADRDAVAGQLYDAARRAGIDPAALTPAAQANMATFAQRLPDAVLDEARQLAKISGEPMTDATSVQGLHWVKKALDSLIARETGPKGSPEFLRAYTGLKNDLLKGMDELSPAYATARQTYAAMSRPINQMEVLQHVLRNGTSATSDLAGNPRLLPDALMRTLRDEPRLIRQATGSGQKALQDLLEPDQLQMLRAIASEADRTGAVARAGNGPGSATAQRLASQNVLRQLVGPTGLPQSWAEGALANTVVGKPLNLLYGGVAEPRIQQALAEAVLDPARARQMLLSARPATGGQSNVLAQLLAAQLGRTALPALAVSRER